jgi:hypothetical protein
MAEILLSALSISTHLSSTLNNPIMYCGFLHIENVKHREVKFFAQIAQLRTGPFQYLRYCVCLGITVIKT